MLDVKPRILLCWAYHRKHFVSFFKEFENEFEFIYLNWASSDLEIGSYTDCRVIYFLDYKNVKELVDDVKPSKVVFMGIEGLATLVNEYCKIKGIPTFFLQHGVFHPYAAYVEEENLEKRKLVKSSGSKQYTKVNTKSLSDFLLSSFSLELLNAYRTIFQQKILFRIYKSKHKSLYFTKSAARRADKYIVFTKYSSHILQERDGVKDGQFIEIGNPETDTILRQIDEVAVREVEAEYYLLIDDPLSETVDSNGFLSNEAINEFHFKLNNYALQLNKKLVIKLHPDNYESTWLGLHPNIIYKRDSNIASLIKFSIGVFGGLSTLLIPALVTRPCCLFQLNEKYTIHKFIREINYCPVLDLFSFTEQDIRFNDNLTTDQKKKFIKAYLYRDDRGSYNRLKDILKRGAIV